MSHVAEIEIEITDLAALAAGCRRLGFVFKDGQRSYKWYGRWEGDYPLPEGFSQEDLGKCDHAIKRKLSPGHGSSHPSPGQWRPDHTSSADSARTVASFRRTHQVVWRCPA